MGFFDQLEKIQHAPLKKRRILFLIALIAWTTIIIGIWVIQLRVTLKENAGPEKTIATEKQPLNFLWLTTKDGFSSLKDVYNTYEEKIKTYGQQ